MSLSYIRKAYNVPAYRGSRVRYRGEWGRILSARNPGMWLAVRIDNGKRIRVHPTDDDLVYLEDPRPQIGNQQFFDLIKRCEAALEGSDFRRLVKLVPGKVCAGHGPGLTAVYDKQSAHYMGFLKPVCVGAKKYWTAHHPGSDRKWPPGFATQRLALRKLLESWVASATKESSRERYL